MYVEMSQGDSLYSYLKQTKMSLFFLYTIGEQKHRTSPAWGVNTGGRGCGEMVWEGEYGTNTVYTCM
jgi:hypothetical protein